MYYQDHKEELDNLSINDLDHLVGWLRDIRQQKYHSQYVELKVYSGRGNIADELKAVLGNQVFFRQSDSPHGRGTNVILIVRQSDDNEITTEDYIELVRQQLLAHFTDHFNQIEF